MAGRRFTYMPRWRVQGSVAGTAPPALIRERLRTIQPAALACAASLPAPVLARMEPVAPPTDTSCPALEVPRAVRSLPNVLSLSLRPSATALMSAWKITDSVARR
jgi:hypothetical protein